MIRLCGLLLLLSGCATTTTVLLPDESGKVGALVLKHGRSERVVDQAYTAARDWALVDDVSLNQLSKEQVERRYDAALKALPASPVSFVVYFREGSADLTDESAGSLAVIAEACKARMPTRVYVIGHTDRVGDKEFNLQLSLARAKRVEQQLRGFDAVSDNLEVRSFGESDPLVPTLDGVAEARNRRVEVLIL